MDRLEAIVRDTLAEHAADAPQVVSSRAVRRPRRTWWAAAAAATVVVVVAGFAAQHTGGKGTDRSGLESQQTVPAVSPHTPPATSSTAAQGSGSANKRLAAAETRRLLALFAVPRSAQRLTSAPATLDRPAMGTPATASLIDTAHYWRVAMSLAQAKTWVKSHPPTGVTPDGSATGSGPQGLESVGYGYADKRSSHAWIQAELDIGLAPAGPRSTVWRIDGLAQWLDPQPETAPTAQHPLRVTVASGCPSSDRGADEVPPGPSQSLLPKATPNAALICAYTGLNGDAFALTAHHLLAANDAARLATLARRTNLAHTLGGTISCPADFGTATVIAFSYASDTTDLRLTDSGCRSLSNGTITTSSLVARGLQPFIAAVTRATANH